MTQNIKLSEDQWIDEYGLELAPNGCNSGFSIDGAERMFDADEAADREALERINKESPNQIFSLVEGEDDGESELLHEYVPHARGYFVATKPIPNGEKLNVDFEWF